MTEKKQDAIKEDNTDRVPALFKEGYTKQEATQVLSMNAGREVHEDYVRGLARNKHVRALKIHARLTLYNKHDVNTYKVEAPGVKAGQIAKEQAAARKKAGARRPRRTKSQIKKGENQ